MGRDNHTLYPGNRTNHSSDGYTYLLNWAIWHLLPEIKARFTFFTLVVAWSMFRMESAPTIDLPQLGARQLWVVAVLCFGIGDVVTTSVGLGLPGVAELHPVGSVLFEHSPLAAMIGLKTIVLGGCYILWKHTPRPHCIGVPLGLALLGVIATVWNTSVLVGSLLL